MAPRTSLATVAASVWLAVTSGCGPSVDARSRPVRAPVRTSLVESFRPAMARPVLDRLGFKDRAEQRYLPWGFNAVSARGLGAWTEGRAALIEVPRAMPQSLRLSLTVAPFTGEGVGLPDQSLRLLWNDHDLGAFKVIGRQTIEVEVGKEQVHAGINRLLLLPSFWVVPRELGLSKDSRQLGVRCLSLVVEAERPGLRGPDAVVEDGVLRQHPGSIVTLPLVLPEEPSLRASGRLASHPDPPAASARGRLTLTLEDPDGRVHVLGRESLRGLVEDPVFELDQDLSEWSGQPVNLSACFAVEAAGAEETADWEVVWDELAVEGTRPAAPESAADPARGRHNVVVILCDALRADPLGPYGGEVATPFLDRLAAGGVTFEDAQSTCSWTRPAVASLLTSLYPDVHGIHDVIHAVPEGAPMLAELLRDEGYTTLAVVNNPQISAAFGFGAGFDAVQEIYDQADVWYRADPGARAEAMYELYLQSFFDERDGDTPFFLYFHDIDPHSPYDPPPPYDQAYVTGGRFHHGTNKLVTQLIQKQAMPLGTADVRWLGSQYHGEIAFMDAFVEALVGILDGEGLMDDTLLVFLSDHGEEFMEHGGIHHGRTLHGEMLDVPLILHLEGRLPAGRRVAGPVSLVDVAPTILDLVGAPQPAVMQGESLLSSLMTGALVADRSATFARNGLDGRERRAVRHGDWKLIVTLDRGRTRAELYHVGDDPEEQVDLYPVRPGVGRVLGALLEAQVERDRQLDVGEGRVIELGELDDATIAELRALGYLK